MDRPTDEDMATDLTLLADDTLGHAPGCWWMDPDRSRKGVCTCGADDYAEAAEAAMRRATYAEAELARLRAFFEEFTDGVGPCACCGTLLGWVFAGDGTYDRELWTGQKHDCPVSAEDFRNGKFPQGTYRFQERRAIDAEAELVRLREEAASQRRKGRIDACRVLNEAASRFPAASNILRECVRDIERMDR